LLQEPHAGITLPESETSLSCEYVVPSGTNQHRQVFDKNTLQNDVADGLQYKIVMDDTIAAVFSICYSDPIIWREKDQGDAVYLHRVVVNPRFKGQKQFEKIMHWAKAHAAEKKMPYLRMDTWGDNPNIIAYYQSFGFRLVGNVTNPDDEGLPIQNRNLYLALLEY